MHGAALSLLAFSWLPQAGGKGVVVEKPTARVVLKSGSSFEGRVLSEDEKTIRLAVSFGEILLKKEEVSRVDRGEGLAIVDEQPIPVEAEKPPAPKKIPMGFQLPPPLPAEEKPSKASAAPVPAPAPASGVMVSSDRKIEGMLSHYLWFLPEAGNAKFLLGAAFFLGFLFLFFLACRLAGIEDLSVNKALAFCGVFFAVLSIQVHFDPKQPNEILLYGLMDLAVWFGLVRLVLKEPLHRGGSVLAFFVFAALLGVLGSELGYVLVHQA